MSHSEIEQLLVSAFQSRQQDLPEQSLIFFMQARELAPDDLAIRIEVARTYLDLALREKCEAVLDTIQVDATQAEDEVELTMELARLWVRVGDAVQALRLFRSIPLRSTQGSQAVLEAVLLLERTHRLDEARIEATRLDGNRSSKKFSPLSALARAVLDERSGDTITASARLRRAWENTPDSALRVECGYRLARLLDRQEQHQEALGILEHCKQSERGQMPGPLLEKQTAQRRQSDLDTLHALPPDWFQSRQNTLDCSRILVLGHPRSGTSLLSRRISQSSQATWVDECPAFSVLARRLSLKGSRDNPRFAEFLRGLDHDSITQFEHDYLDRMKQFSAQGPGNTTMKLIDKNPGLSNSLPALHKLLPNSAWVYLQRDPRDVAISCYFQRFGPTPLGWACQTLQGAMEAVLHTAKLWLIASECLNDEQVIPVRYESLVDSPDSTIDSIVSRLGWECEKTTRAGQETEPEIVHSPTYAEVRRPIDARAVNRWQRHAKAFGSLAVKQSQIIESLGYDSDES